MTATVAVFGGGVGGLTAAHELGERGFSVDVFERRPIVAAGGKARSIRVPGSAVGDRKPLPGEHGFRFFPGFYQHIPDTMERIPIEGQNKSVVDNLVTATKGLFAGERIAITIPGSFPDTIDEIKSSLFGAIAASQVGVDPEELRFFIERLLVLLTMCPKRRFKELETKSWFEFVDADGRSNAYKKYLADGMTRRCVAARADEMSARTCGVILLQLLGCFEPGMHLDRLLNAPTNDAWIDPWVAHSQSLGVRFHGEQELTGFECHGGRITGATVQGPDGPAQITADYYVAALPVDRMAPLVTDAMRAAAPSLEGMQELMDDVRWMNGIQFFLDRPLPIVKGHIVYPDGPFSLTSVSQAQFWADVDLSGYGDGTVKDVLSVDISDWETPGVLFNKRAMDLTPKEIEQEVIEQLSRALNRDGEVGFPTDAIRHVFLDDDIVSPNPPGQPLVNLEPLLINKVNAWELRPPAVTGMENFFLAADYVQTNTDLATMEGANEAARRAVNGILEVERSRGGMTDQDDCRVFELREPAVFRPFKNLDDSLLDSNIEHLSEFLPAGFASAMLGFADVDGLAKLVDVKVLADLFPFHF